MVITRRWRQRAARAGLLAWSLAFVLAPLVHLAAHRDDHRHRGEGVLWTLDEGHRHDDHVHFEEAAPQLDPDALEHGDGAGHLHAAVLPPPLLLPIFRGRLPAHGPIAAIFAAAVPPRIWSPQHPRAPPLG